MEWEKPLPQGRTRSVGNGGCLQLEELAHGRVLSSAQAVRAREAPEGHGLEDSTRFRRDQEAGTGQCPVPGGLLELEDLLHGRGMWGEVHGNFLCRRKLKGLPFLDICREPKERGSPTYLFQCS